MKLHHPKVETKPKAHSNCPRCHGNVGYSGQCIDNNPTYKPIYLVVGIPGSGKSWVCEQLSNFKYIRHDDFQRGPESYTSEIFYQANQQQNGPILIETPFSVSKIKDPLEAKGYQVIPVFIIESPETVTERYTERFKEKGPEDKAKALKQVKGNLTRQETYKKRAEELKAFSGTSSEVLEYLRTVK